MVRKRNRFTSRYGGDLVPQRDSEGNIFMIPREELSEEALQGLNAPGSSTKAEWEAGPSLSAKDSVAGFTQKYTGEGGRKTQQKVSGLTEAVKDKQKEKVKGDLSGAQGAKQAGAQIAGQMVQGSGVFGDSDVGAGLEAGGSYALMAGATGGMAAINPWLLGGTILMGVIASRSKRKAADKERRRQAIQTAEASKMRAREEFARGMRQIYSTSAGRRLNL